MPIPMIARKLTSSLGIALAAASTIVAAQGLPAKPDSAPTPSGGLMMRIPLQAWAVDAKSFIGQISQARSSAGKGGTTKAATDRATVYRPVPVCRLIDTRGLAAAIAIAGPLAPGTTMVNSAGFCGIPNGGTVAGISLSFHVWNHTINSGGFISFLEQDVNTNPVPAGVNAVFNEGSTWTAATANVSLPDDSGNFKIFIANATTDVIVDVNGYYQDLDNLDVGTQELDIGGDTVGDLFELTNLGSGSALTAGNFGLGAPANPALTITQGTVRASGAGVDTPTFAFIHHVTAASLCSGDSTSSLIDNALLNGDTGAIALVTPRFDPDDTSAVEPAAATPMIEYHTATSCAGTVPAGRWFLRTPGTTLVTNSYYNVLVIKP